MRTDRWFVALPIASYLWLFMTVLIAGALHPGYSHVGQFMSELGAQGAPGGWMVNYLGFLPTEILFLGFVGLAFRRAGRDGVTRVGLVLLGLYAVSLIIAAFIRAMPDAVRRIPPSAISFTLAAGWAPIFSVSRVCLFCPWGVAAGMAICLPGWAFSLAQSRCSVLYRSHRTIPMSASTSVPWKPRSMPGASRLLSG